MPLIELNEFSVYYEDHGSGEPVLLIAGIGADHGAWATQTDFLRERCRVVVFDNPGVGQTRGPRRPYTSELFADVTAALIERLELGPTHIIGASMGGTIAQQLALRYPTHVRSLQLHCTWGRADRYLTALFRSWQSYARVVDPLERARQIWLWVYTPRWYESKPQEMEKLEQAICNDPFPQSPDAFSDQAEACISHDALAELSRITAPTLISVGDHDLLAPPYHSHAMNEQMSNALLHIWPDMGHAPFAETPNDFNRLCLTFLRAH